MTDIMKLIEELKVSGSSIYLSRKAASAIEALQGEVEQVKGFWKEAQLRNRNLLEENSDLAMLADQYKAERDLLQAKLDAAPKALEPLTEAAKRCCQHDSDCAIHNMPAYPAGPCDCSLQTVAWVSVEKGDVSKAILYFDENEEIKPLGVIGAATTRKANGITKGTPT